MKKLIFILSSALLPCLAYAQTGKGDDNDDKALNDSIALNEIVVRGSRIDNKSDAMRIFPTKEQKEASATGYGLLSRLSLPYITVDEVQRSISAPSSLGEVQVRINDIVASGHDLVSLDMQQVRHVDFIQNPGSRYGQNVKFVINIVTARPKNGYTIGADLLQTLTAMRMNDNVFAKFNSGKSELGISYSYGYTDFKRSRYEETANYLMPDNTTTTVRREDTGIRNKSLSHDLQLQYNIADTARYTLQVTLGGNISRMPDNTRQRTTQSDNFSETLQIGSTDETKQTAIDIYMNYNITKRQSLTANMSGIYTKSDYAYSYGGSSPFAYTSAGKNRSLFGELIYENRLRPFTLSAGLKYDYTGNEVNYSGDTEANNDINTSNAYAYAQLTGMLGKLSYRLGTGVNFQHYRQDHETYDYWLWRPEFEVSWSPVEQLRFSYLIRSFQKAPRLEYLGNATVRNNEMELTAGNPTLHANRDIEQSFTASYQHPSIFTSFTAFYRSCPHCSMMQIDRITDGGGNTYFRFSRTNQRRISMFYIDNYTRYNALPDKLSLTFTGCLLRCFNYGDDYTHHHSSFNMSARADIYLGKLSFSANVDNGWSFLEGESRVKPSWVHYLTATYKLGDLSVSLFWQHCFQNKVKSHEGELLNRYVNKTQTIYNRDFGNMVTINITWRLQKGHKRDRIKRSGIRRNSDTGIMKN